MKQSVYARNYESLMGAEVAKRPGMHSHGGEGVAITSFPRSAWECIRIWQYEKEPLPGRVFGGSMRVWYLWRDRYAFPRGAWERGVRRVLRQPRDRGNERMWMIGY